MIAKKEITVVQDTSKRMKDLIRTWIRKAEMDTIKIEENREIEGRTEKREEAVEMILKVALEVKLDRRIIAMKNKEKKTTDRGRITRADKR